MLTTYDWWFDASCVGNTTFWESEGNQTLNWKSNGYKTVFDLLTVLYSISTDTQSKIIK